jgi:hypothetical protein
MILIILIVVLIILIYFVISQYIKQSAILPAAQSIVPTVQSIVPTVQSTIKMAPPVSQTTGNAQILSYDDELVGLCPNISMCESINQIDMNDWTVNCDGWSEPNTLHKGLPTDWNWLGQGLTGTTKHYSSAVDAITTACPKYTDPVSIYKNVNNGMCTSVVKIKNNEWLVSCKDQPSNILHMNTPTQWIWIPSGSPGTNGTYPDPLTAINNVCLDIMTPNNACSQIEGGGCTAANQIDPTHWNVACAGQVPNVLQMNGANDWTWKNSNIHYADPLKAMNSYCMPE